MYRIVVESVTCARAAAAYLMHPHELKGVHGIESRRRHVKVLSASGAGYRVTSRNPAIRNPPPQALHHFRSQPPDGWKQTHATTNILSEHYTDRIPNAVI
ncbi:unnamed protein product [Danaus chrysippus]|uniref:(African queen) hypothetical protein n=1 Tax=Danaus chrysippus TaxID=151541 RepID=A0A8J2QF88_9NEOP|nr:unnamed protein product [Danaus chrysippus]